MGMATWAITTASIVAITQTDESAAAPSAWGCIALSLILGTVLVAFALPRVVVDSALTVAHPAIRAVEAGYRPGVSETLADAVGLAAASDRSAEAWSLAGRLDVAMAVYGGGLEGPARSAAFAAAGGKFAHALARSPMDTRDWLRYTHALLASDQFIEAARAWRLSVLTGAFDPNLMFARERVGLSLWRYMDLPTRDAFGQQLLVHWRWGPGGLAELLAKHGGGDIGVAALAPWPDAAADLRRRLDRMAGR